MLYCLPGPLSLKTLVVIKLSKLQALKCARLVFYQANNWRIKKGTLAVETRPEENLSSEVTENEEKIYRDTR